MEAVLGPEIATCCAACSSCDRCTQDDTCSLTADAEAESDLQAPTAVVLRELRRQPRSLKEAARLRLPAPVCNEDAARCVLLHLLARWKLQLTPTSDHRDGVLVETADAVFSIDDAVKDMHSIFTSHVLRATPAEGVEGTELDDLLTEYRTRELQLAREQQALLGLRRKCLLLAYTYNRSDVIGELSG